MAATFAEFEGVARGNPKIRAGAAVTVSGLGEPFDGKYTVTTSRHRFEPDHRLHDLRSRSAADTTAACWAWPPAATRPVRAPVRGGHRPGQRHRTTRRRPGRVKLTFPWLSDDYVSDWARTVQLGAGKDRGWAVLPEVGDEVLVAFEQGDFSRPYVLGGLYNGVDTMPAGPTDLVDGGSGAINRRSMVSRNGHRIDLLDQNGKTEGISLITKDDKLFLKLDHVGTTITVHADGKVLVEGSQGITIDSASAAMELKGGQISLEGDPGRDGRRRRRRRVGEVGQPAQPLRGHRQARGQRHHRGQGRRDVLGVGRHGQDQLSGRDRRRAAMPMAARVGDPTGHPGVIGPPGVPTVLIGGMPAATVGTPHICSFPPPAVAPADGDRPARLPDRADRRHARGPDGRHVRLRCTDRDGLPRP